MSKRFTDTDKYKKTFVRSLPGAYKILWDYLYHDCSHAGVWHKDFQIAQIYIGADMPVNEADALMYFNKGEERIVEISNGSKWFIRPFIDFQYGSLNPLSRVHASVLRELDRYQIKGLTNPLERVKDKDKVKDKVKDSLRKNKQQKGQNQDFLDFWQEYPKKVGKGDAARKWDQIKPDINLKTKILRAVFKQQKNPNWQKEGGQYIPNPATWLHQERWEDQDEFRSNNTQQGGSSIFYDKVVGRSKQREQNKLGGLPDL